MCKNKLKQLSEIKDFGRENCKLALLAGADTMDLLKGKWKVPILITLILFDKMKYNELLKTVEGIGTKMLLKELNELEVNHLISRSVSKTKPLSVSYQITGYGKHLERLIVEILNWGITHRKNVRLN
jgi:DNA-binding HxlR family transcriptional regulator